MACLWPIHTARSSRRLNPNNPLTMEIEQATCAVCGYEMEPVRPGKHQCNHCEAVEFLEGRWHESSALAGQLVAMIRMNVKAGTFATATVEQVEHHLKPLIERLDAVKPVPNFSPTNA